MDESGFGSDGDEYLSPSAQRLFMMSGGAHPEFPAWDHSGQNNNNNEFENNSTFTTDARHVESHSNNEGNDEINSNQFHEGDVASNFSGAQNVSPNISVEGDFDHPYKDDQTIDYSSEVMSAAQFRDPDFGLDIIPQKTSGSWNSISESLKAINSDSVSTYLDTLPIPARPVPHEPRAPVPLATLTSPDFVVHVPSLYSTDNNQTTSGFNTLTKLSVSAESSSAHPPETDGNHLSDEIRSPIPVSKTPFNGNFLSSPLDGSVRNHTDAVNALLGATSSVGSSKRSSVWTCDVPASDDKTIFPMRPGSIINLYDPSIQRALARGVLSPPSSGIDNVNQYPSSTLSSQGQPTPLRDSLMQRVQQDAIKDSQSAAGSRAGSRSHSLLNIPAPHSVQTGGDGTTNAHVYIPHPEAKPYLKVGFPSRELAHRTRQDLDSCLAVQRLYRAMHSRSSFIPHYDEIDSETVFPPPPSNEQWASHEPDYRPYECSFRPNLNAKLVSSGGVFLVYSSLQTAAKRRQERCYSKSLEAALLHATTVSAIPDGADKNLDKGTNVEVTSDLPDPPTTVSLPERTAGTLLNVADSTKPPSPHSLAETKSLPVDMVVSSLGILSSQNSEDVGLSNIPSRKDELPLLTKGIPSVFDYLSALNNLMAVTMDPACKSLAYSRLRYLEQRFGMHILFNGSQEITETRQNGHRDFYNVRKVDTHVHHSACMNQKHLLRFIREKYNSEGDTIVAKDAEGNPVTLSEIFKNDLQLSAHQISIDHLNVHALNSCFHRFDIFNSKYNPFGTALLREVFLKTDNMIGGRFLAEMTQEVIKDLEEKKYQHYEYRLSIYGRRRDEWKKMANWLKTYDLYSKNIRWIVQVPRLYHVYKKFGLINSMGDLLRNIFEPVFEAVLFPEDNPEVYEMIFQVSAWDSVDDESVVSKFSTAGGNIPDPDEWTRDDNPPYAYWMYYMYANIRSLNILLQGRKMRPMKFRPHCGEAGSISHLASAFLLADGINHGLTLRKAPVLQYLYYLTQVGLAMSPLSNNALFHEISKSPFPAFFKIGMNVSLSSDDPLMFHFTDEPLLEEYGVCAHLWKLSPVDLCEIAVKGVLQSSYEPQYKRHWLGSQYDKLPLVKGNDITCTNVPNIRVQYRHDTLMEEMQFLADLLHKREFHVRGNSSSSTAHSVRHGGASPTQEPLTSSHGQQEH